MQTDIIADNQLEKLRLDVERSRQRFSIATTVMECPAEAIVDITLCRGWRDKRPNISKIS